MAQDPVFRCPGCGSLLTAEASFPGTWECRYCACLFPVETGGNILAWLLVPVSDPGPVKLGSPDGETSNSHRFTSHRFRGA